MWPLVSWPLVSWSLAGGLLVMGLLVVGPLAPAVNAAGSDGPPTPPSIAPDAARGAAELIVQLVEGDVIARLPLDETPTWIVRWNHSVTGVEVSDYYGYIEGRMVLMQSHTPAFDAGLGHIPGRGRLESDGHGGYWIRGIDEPVPGNAYRLRVGPPAVDHRIVHGDRVISLSEIAAGRAVTIRVASP